MVIRSKIYKMICILVRSLAFYRAIGLVIWIAGFSCSSYAHDPIAQQTLPTITNIIQFRTLPSEDYLRQCPFRLIGTVTLVDTNRDLLVLQDATGAVAINFKLTDVSVEPGQRVCLEGMNVSPYDANFPNYPYRPSGWDIRPTFDAPANWGDYHLTRMRGYLHPPVTGNYTFWIASDNSSELWISPDEDPAKVERIAMVKEGNWTSPHEWSRYPSQRSRTLFLQAGQTHYIEAFQEQITLNDNLSVAWQGPGLSQSVIDGHYLTPWVENSNQIPFAETNGILREYWTNYYSGSLSGITGPRHFESALSAEGVRLTVLGNGTMPEPVKTVLGQPLHPENNYHWVEVEGTVTFVAGSGNSAILEMNGGQAQIHISHYSQTWMRHLKGYRVRALGVCEGVYDSSDILMPSLIWTPAEGDVQIVESTETNLVDIPKSSPFPYTLPTDTNSWREFYATFYTTRGVVTFKDRVFGTNCLFVQDENHGFFVSQPQNQTKTRLQVGQLVELGGYLVPGNYSPSIQPLLITILGWGAMPEPDVGPTDKPVTGNQNNRWAEVEGVVHAVDANGVIKIVGRKGSVSVWIGKTPMNILNRYTDSTLRIRGVMSLSTFGAPLLLVPSRDFVEVEETSPENPFALPRRPIADLKDLDTGFAGLHRIKVEGTVTYRNSETLFVQDESGGACVLSVNGSNLQLGDQASIVGFLDKSGPCLTISEALARRIGSPFPVRPEKLDSAGLTADKNVGTLVQVKATLLGQKDEATSQILELQDEQRVFDAVLTTNQGKLPSLTPGSRLQITGICMANSEDSSISRKIVGGDQLADSVQLWLRASSDIKLLSGPPWWTWKRTVVLISTLIAVITGTLLWIALLHRHLERQQATKLIFSRQILQSQEDERHRIAGNLHDSLGQNLLVIKNQTRLAMQPADELVLRQRLNKISEVVSRSLDEVRQITHDLRPYQLDRLGLTQAIRSVVNHTSENSHILIASHMDNIDGIFDKESEIHVYRIVQEGINNIIKHSGANEAVVVIKKHEAVISLSIRDNGHGFGTSPTDPTSSDDYGFGLNGMRERTQILNGKLTVDSQAGQGVNLSFEIPIPPSLNGK